MHDGQFYENEAAMLRALEHEPDGVHLFKHHPSQTAAELLAEAEERAKNPLPEVTLEELGEYGRQLVTDGVSPAVAKHLEALQV